MFAPVKEPSVVFTRKTQTGFCWKTNSKTNRSLLYLRLPEETDLGLDGNMVRSINNLTFLTSGTSRQSTLTLTIFTRKTNIEYIIIILHNNV